MEAYLLFLLLAVRVLLPLDKNRINEEQVTHVEGEEADDAEDHDDDHLDDDGVPLLVSAHAPRAEGLGQPPHVLLLHIQTRDDHVHAVAVAAAENVICENESSVVMVTHTWAPHS